MRVSSFGTFTSRGAVSASRQNSAELPSTIPAVFCKCLLISRKLSPFFWGKTEVRNSTPFTSPRTFARPLPQASFALKGMRTMVHPKLERSFSRVARKDLACDLAAFIILANKPDTGYTESTEHTEQMSFQFYSNRKYQDETRRSCLFRVFHAIRAVHVWVSFRCFNKRSYFELIRLSSENFVSC